MHLRTTVERRRRDRGPVAIYPLIRQFPEPSLHAVHLDVGKLLAAHARRALVGTGLGVGMRQDVLPVNPVVQRVKPKARLGLRFRV